MSLRKRVCELEDQVRELRRETGIDIPVCGGFSPREIPVKDVVKQIVEHLGLEWEYVPGRESSVKLERKKKK